RIEFIDEVSVRAFNSYAKRDFPEQPHLLIEFNGSEASVASDAERFGELAEEFGGQGFQWAATTEERNALWKMRHQAYPAQLSVRPGSTAVVTDICVPMSKQAVAVAAAHDDIAADGMAGPILGHVGDGNFHSALLVEPGNEDELKRAKALARRMAERALAVGGTITGEHGVGIGKRALMAGEHGEAWAVMGAIKAALDPNNILNPGKLVPDRN
ncbi:MAG: FAD-binding oxidoreductase, partial [Paracoccus sp. (in: a-proteobacteria)]